MNAHAFATKDAFEIELLIEALADYRDMLVGDEHEAGENVHEHSIVVIDRMLRLLKGE
jgi:hypothetical protein